MGRPWHSVEGNLYASSLVRLNAGDPPASTLALVMAVALHRALSDYVSATAIRIKWPNDIMAGDAKLAGILLEQQGDAIIAGVGVNIVAAPAVAGRRTTSLHDLGAARGDVVSVLHDIRRAFAEEVQSWRAEDGKALAPRWMERSYAPGVRLAVIMPDNRKIEGRYHRLNEDGALVLRDETGADHIIHTADVFLT